MVVVMFSAVVVLKPAVDVMFDNEGGVGVDVCEVVFWVVVLCLRVVAWLEVEYDAGDDCENRDDLDADVRELVCASEDVVVVEDVVEVVVEEVAKDVIEEDSCIDDLPPTSELREEDINEGVVDLLLDLGEECVAIVELFEMAYGRELV